jgi:hypothetical protein
VIINLRRKESSSPGQKGDLVVQKKKVSNPEQKAEARALKEKKDSSLVEKNQKV